jgi:DNA-binding transcriptional ArsR family regulator
MGNYSVFLNKAFHALSDPTRRAVLNRLIDGPASVKELAESFEMGLPSFMKHIKVLEDSDLITSQKQGRIRTCYLQPKQLAAAENWLGQQRALWEARTDRLAEYAQSLASKEHTK